MVDQRRTNQLSINDLRRKVAWLFYGTRTFEDLDQDSQFVVDDIINDGYERFLNPPPAPGNRSTHRWNFLRPYWTFTTVAAQDEYTMPEDFGGLDGPLYYKRTDNRWFPILKVDPNKILARRQIDSLPTTSYPTEFSVVVDFPSTSTTTSTTLMLWPTPDAAYTLSGRYFVISSTLSDDRPYPICPATHNQCLTEAVLSVAEERLEDSPGLHKNNFLESLQAAVSLDRDQFSPDHLPIDRDRSDDRYSDYHYQSNYVSYNGYVPGV